LITDINLSIDSHDFIKIIFENVQNLRIQSFENVVITSVQAASWLMRSNIEIQGMIFTNSEKSQRLLAEKFRDIVLSKSVYADDLAAEILKYPVQEVIHLTGNLGLRNMEKSLEKSPVVYHRKEVYFTELNPKKFPYNFDYILVASPSQVKSFFELNEDTPSSQYICIGKTTKEALLRFSIPDSRVILSPKPTKQAMLDCLKERTKKI
jgi:uroporphyrinogen-III synthase